MGRSKGKAGTQLKYIPEKRDTFEIYPRKVMHIIGGYPFQKNLIGKLILKSFFPSPKICYINSDPVFPSPFNWGWEETQMDGCLNKLFYLKQVQLVMNCCIVVAKNLVKGYINILISLCLCSSRQEHNKCCNYHPNSYIMLVGYIILFMGRIICPFNCLSCFSC